MKRVVLKSTVEFTGEETDKSDEELIEQAKEIFYLDGAEVSGEVIEVDN